MKAENGETMAHGEFTLSHRLAKDTLPVLSLPLCEVRLMNDSRFVWIVLAPRRAGAEELFDLSTEDRARLIEEVAACAAALKRMTGADKINVGALGNIVRQLHVHVVARRERDAAWPGPVWGAGASIPYEDPEADRLIANLRGALSAA